jgi:NADH:ubiquinone oxidoreductase subunit E
MNVSEPNVNNGCRCGCDAGSKMDVQNSKLKEADEIIYKHKTQKGPLLSILNEFQDSFGYLPRAALEETSKVLDMPLAEIYGVATFYSRFTLKPRGEHTISVCLGTACYVKGAKDIFDELLKELKLDGSGETTDDGKFTLEATRCLGCCGLSPVMMIDGEVYGRLTPEKVPEILKKY